MSVSVSAAQRWRMLGALLGQRHEHEGDGQGEQHAGEAQDRQPGGLERVRPGLGRSDEGEGNADPVGDRVEQQQGDAGIARDQGLGPGAPEFPRGEEAESPREARGQHHPHGQRGIESGNATGTGPRRDRHRDHEGARPPASKARVPSRSSRRRRSSPRWRRRSRPSRGWTRAGRGGPRPGLR